MKSIKDRGDYTNKTNIVNMHFSRHGLESLEGSPKKITGSFFCDNNYLRTLEYGPRIVGGEFNCNGNILRTLEGAPVVVGRPEAFTSFNCRNNVELRSLEGAPIAVRGGSFVCIGCPKLESLEHLPKRVDVFVICDDRLKKGENLYLIANAMINGRIANKERATDSEESIILRDVLVYYFT